MKVLTLSRNYPNAVIPHLGLWVEGLTRHLAARCSMHVVAPVPYAPPLPNGIGARYTRFRTIPTHRVEGDLTIHHPRFLTGPGNSVYPYEADLMFWSLSGFIDRLHRSFPFDVIHAHFTYADGAVGARLAARYGVPLVITEYALWRPWMEKNARVRRAAVAAIHASRAFTAASTALRDSMVAFAGSAEKCHSIPYGIDPEVFHAHGRAPVPEQIVTVGRFQPVKGVDVLIKAFAQVAAARPNAHLTLVGGSLYQTHEEDAIRALVSASGLDRRVTFAGVQPPTVVADILRRSAFLISPSRRESFGSALIEALACGTPVLATRSGGPSDILSTPDLGQLVPVEDPAALAKGILWMFDHQPLSLSDAAVENVHRRYDWGHVADQMRALYDEVLS